MSARYFAVAMNSFASDQEFQRYLDAGETILWRGQPKQGLMLRPHDALMIPFSLMWGGFAIVWEVVAMTNGAPLFFMLWGVPFVLVGLYIMFGRFFGDAKMRERTYYALTTKRALILSGLFSRSLKAAELDNVGAVDFTERGDGSGTLVFGPSQVPAWFIDSGMPMSGRQLPPAFSAIPDAKAVYDKVREAQKRLKG